jgi:hypothetical protein
MKPHEAEAIRARAEAGEATTDDVRALLAERERLLLKTGIECSVLVRYEVETEAESREVIRRIEEGVAAMQLDDDPDRDVHNVSVSVYRVRRNLPFGWLNAEKPENQEREP